MMTITNLLLALFSLALTCSLPSTLLAQPAPHEAEGVFSGWSLTSIAPHPSQPIVHLVDQRRYIHTINVSDGSLIREGWIVTGVEASIDYLTVDSRGNTYAVLTSLFRSEHSVLALDDQLQPRHQFRLDIPSNDELTLLDRPLLADSKGMLYVVGRLLNGTYIVYVYEGATGNHVDTWVPSHPVRNLDYVVNIDAAGFLYFQQTSLLTNGGRYTFLYSTGGVFSDYLIVDGRGCNEVTSVAISTQLDIAIVCDGSDIRMYNSYGARVDTFQYVNDGLTVTQLTLDYHDTLVAITGGGAVMSVRADGSGAKRLWRPNQSSFSEAALMTYDPFSDSLLTYYVTPIGISRPVQRVDTRSGALLDLLRLPERLIAPLPPFGNSNCYLRSVSVGRRTGLLYRLLTCTLPSPHQRLYVSTAAGQVKRELTLMQWDRRPTIVQPMAVDEELDIVLIALDGPSPRFCTLYAFSLSNGTALYNVSLGLTGYISELTAAANHTALLTFSARIFVLNMADGSQVQQIQPSLRAARFTSAAFDGQHWYLALSLPTGTGGFNSSVQVWDAAQQQVQAVLVVGNGHRQTWLTQPTELSSIVLTNDGRVLALDRFRLAAWWDMRRQDEAAPVKLLMDGVRKQQKQ